MLSFSSRSFHSSPIALRNILVGVDGSGYSDKAFREALLTAKKEDHLYLLTVPAIPTSTYSFVLDESNSGTLKQLLSECKNEAKAVLAQYKDSAVAFGISPTRTHEILGEKMGSTRLEILYAVEQYKIDLLILGSHSKGAIGKLFLGSTSDFLVHHAPCDVMIVKLSKDEKEDYSKRGMLETRLDPQH